ncbi:uncharacterized protein LOC121726544 [Aricia agestis]|uniref:uncharacterized protein LOC121726544 n=1 Tax=Aricia agestis TaxID=91739 RepID=UPI001C2038A7|nr:uncharacterized protein LOC121726544 [Aricia agestis]
MISDFAKEKVFWTEKMNLKLVKFIERRPHIWNPKHPKYTSAAIRDRTYAEFAEKYGNEFTGQAVKDRWTNIRSTFANYLRKIKNGKTKTNGEEYKVNWHLWDACQFLLTVNKGLKHEYVDEACEDEVTENNDFLFRDCDSFEQDTCNNIAQNLVTILKGVQNDAFGLDNTEYDEIGRTVTRKLSEMNSWQASQAIHKITGILLLYDPNNPLNPNNFKLESM